MSNAITKLIPPKLEPCPHCGSEPIMKPREHNVSYIVICWRCGLNGPTDELGVQSCADSWNKLSRAARLLAAVEGLASQGEIDVWMKGDDTWVARTGPSYSRVYGYSDTPVGAIIALADTVKELEQVSQ